MFTIEVIGENEKRRINVDGQDVADFVETAERMQLCDVYGPTKYVAVLIEQALERRFKSSPLK